MITIDSPLTAQYDVAALLQEVTPLPQELCQGARAGADGTSIIQFVASFISVAEENHADQHGMDDHTTELLLEYKKKNAGVGGLQQHLALAYDQDNSYASEKYEKSVPAHGDKHFHMFMSKIKQSPGQILRYHIGRGGQPLLLYPLLQDGPAGRCKHCQAEMVFEMQVLPTLIPKLRLKGFEQRGSRIEFGTALVFSCSRSCWSPDASVREELVLVQGELY